MMEREEKNRLILAELARLYPDAKPALHFANPFQLLVAVVLSAQCTDVKVNMVTPALFAAYPDAAALAKAEPEEIEPYIKTCGLFRTKARDLKACAMMLIANYGGRVPDTMEELLKLPGVGRKTANLILGDIFGKPAIVCDTHCIRLSNRLGFVKNEKDPVKVENALRKLLDPAESSDFCHRLVLFGREHCTARSPKCEGCPLGAVCPSYPIAK